MSSYDHSSISYSTSGARNLSGKVSSAAVTCRSISLDTSSASGGGTALSVATASRGVSSRQRCSRRTALTARFVAMRYRYAWTCSTSREASTLWYSRTNASWARSSARCRQRVRWVR